LEAGLQGTGQESRLVVLLLNLWRPAIILVHKKKHFDRKSEIFTAANALKEFILAKIFHTAKREGGSGVGGGDVKI
jgi:hypothetical protein